VCGGVIRLVNCGGNGVCALFPTCENCAIFNYFLGKMQSEVAAQGRGE